MRIRLLENYLESENALFEEALLDELFQVPSEGPTVDSLMPFIFVIGAVFLWLLKWEIMLDQFQASNLRLIFESVKNFVDWEMKHFIDL